MNSILVTGGTGTFANAFVRHLLEDACRPDRIIILSRGEYRQFTMRSEIEPLDTKNRLRWFIGDVRDRDRLRRAMQDVDIVVHAAALKRIEVGQYNPAEIVKTNVMGSLNVIESAQDTRVQKVVFLSSDKAYAPVSPYGTSKAMAESLFLAANNTTGRYGPRMAVCRYGNVWCSTGSVVPIWRSILARGEKTVPVTDPECTRFFMRIEDAVKMVMNAIQTMKGGELIIPTLPAYRLGDLAQAMGVTMDIKGLPAWEKMHESMAEGNSSNLARRMTLEELKEALANTTPWTT